KQRCRHVILDDSFRVHIEAPVIPPITGNRTKNISGRKGISPLPIGGHDMKHLARRGTGTAGALLLLSLAASFTGCTSTGDVMNEALSAPEGGGTTAFAAMTMPELDAKADSLGQSYAADPKNRKTALQYAELLTMTGRTDQSLAV